MKKLLLLLALSLFVSQISFSQPYRRVPLVEEFTNAFCGLCYSHHTTIQNVMTETQGKYSWIQYHAFNYPSDPMYIYDNANKNCQGARGSVYSSIMVGTPTIIVNGNTSTYYTNSNIGNPTVFNNSVIENVYATNSFMQLSLDETITGSTATLNIKVKAVGGSTSSSTHKIYIAIVENPVTYSTPPSSSYPLTSYPYVVRDMITSTSGFNLPLANGDSISFPLTYNIPSSLVAANLRTVIYVQNIMTKEVIQSLMGNSAIGTSHVANESLFVGINDAEALSQTLYYDPSFQNISFTNNNNIQSIEIYAIDGSLIQADRQVNDGHYHLANLNAGVYLCRVLTDKNDLITKKIIVY